MMSSAAAWVNPMRTGALMTLSSQPKPPRPSTSCSNPDRKASHTARSTQRALPGSARPLSEAATSRQVSAVGPTDSRVDAPHSTPTSAGSSAAYRPVTSGMPARAA
jgi:hypothetical protein